MNTNIQKSTLTKRCLTFFTLTLLFFSITACGKKIAAEIPKDTEKFGVIEPGEEVLADFTCRLPDHSLVMTTEKSVAEDGNEIKSEIFIPFKEYGPVPVIAGNNKKGPDYGKLKSIESEIFEGLSLAAAGMKPGVQEDIKLTAEDNKKLSSEDRFIELPYVRKQNKNLKMSRSSFKRNYTKAPVPGDIITSPDLKGASFEIMSCDEKELSIRLGVEDGTKIITTAGKGTMYDRGEYIITVMDVNKGDLKRTGVIVGKVSEIKEDTYTLDFINPFGSQELDCKVTVERGGTDVR